MVRNRPNHNVIKLFDNSRSLTNIHNIFVNLKWVENHVRRKEFKMMFKNTKTSNQIHNHITTRLHRHFQQIVSVIQLITDILLFIRFKRTPNAAAKSY